MCARLLCRCQLLLRFDFSDMQAEAGITGAVVFRIVIQLIV